MKVKDLIKELEKLPQDKIVVVESTSMGITEHYPVSLIYEKTLEVTVDNDLVKDFTAILIT